MLVLNMFLYYRYQEIPGYDPKKHIISVFSPTKKIISPFEFLEGAVKKMVGNIRDSDSVSKFTFFCFFIFYNSFTHSDVIKHVSFRHVMLLCMPKYTKFIVRMVGHILPAKDVVVLLRRLKLATRAQAAQRIRNNRLGNANNIKKSLLWE